MLKINNVTKKVANQDVLCGINLCFEEKGIYGVLGVEGAGKTTLARIICGCIDADDGAVMLSDAPMSRSALSLKKKIRLVPSLLTADQSMYAFEYLDFIGSSLGVEPDKKYRQIKEAAELLRIEDLQKRTIASLSTTDNCKLMLAGSLIGNPDVLVIDDSLSYIDRSAVEEIYALLRLLGKIKTLVIFSHTPTIAKDLCKRVAIMCGGKIVLDERAEDIEAKINSTHEMKITVRGNAERIITAIESLTSVVQAKILSADKNDVHSISVEHYPDASIKDKLFSALAAINAPMLTVKSIVLTLDDVFYSLTLPDKKRQEQLIASLSASTSKSRKENM